MNSIFQNVNVIVKRKGAKPHYCKNAPHFGWDNDDDVLNNVTKFYQGMFFIKTYVQILYCTICN
jgi:hypothetical protein